MPPKNEGFNYNPAEDEKIYTPEEKDEIAQKRQRYLEEILRQNPNMPAGDAIELVAARIRAEETKKKE